MIRKYVRFESLGHPQGSYGIIEGNLVRPISEPPWQGGKFVAQVEPVEAVDLLAPVEPSKIVCIGLNYHAHVEASQSAENAPKRPLVFLKPPSSIIGPKQKIIRPEDSGRVDYEAELGVIIGKTARNVDAQNVDDYIFGFTCVNDVTARDLQKIDGQWSRAKGFDTFCPVGPWIVPKINYRDVLVEGIHNGVIKQSGRTSLMIFDIPFLISYISRIMTLNPGDLISTGTPAGIAPMNSGDTIEVRVEGIGTLENTMA